MRVCVTGGWLGRRGEEDRAFKCVAGEKVGVRWGGKGHLNITRIPHNVRGANG